MLLSSGSRRVGWGGEIGGRGGMRGKCFFGGGGVEALWVDARFHV
jgi:hypothetical protein